MTPSLTPARETLWQEPQAPAWDLLVVGGGITGAAVLREAARCGLKALLIEQRDFAWGTSSRSSRMVHGGLRYIAQGDFKLTRDAVRERERLLAEAPGLVEPMRYLFLHRARRAPGRQAFRALLTLYGFFAKRHDHGFLDGQALRWQAPYLSDDGLIGASYYTDAITDDARLVLRLLHEARQDGAVMANYVAAERLLRDDAGTVVGVQVRDAVSGGIQELRANVVINATGAWADRLRASVMNERKVRPLRGSHLIFPAWRLPVFECVTLLHPRDQRPVFIFPWEGATVVGTTDLDHDRELNEEPRMNASELAYLLEVVSHEFPTLEIEAKDAVACYAGVRPVIGTGRDPSKERRDHVVWRDQGLVTVTGGKLTTCRLIALDALRAAGVGSDSKTDTPTFPRANPPPHHPLTAQQWRRLSGRYGTAAADVASGARDGELERVPGTQTLWAELRWAARCEAVEHLDDLLLRRTRLGLLLPEGGKNHLPRIRAICQPELRWDDGRWSTEEKAYASLWQRCYSVPEGTPSGKSSR
jgi:glycerol-3-phosphate dehydrogenase